MSAIVSLIATTVLLLAAGPIASLGGVLLGEVAILVLCQRNIARRRKQGVVA